MTLNLNHLMLCVVLCIWSISFHESTVSDRERLYLMWLKLGNNWPPTNKQVDKESIQKQNLMGFREWEIKTQISGRDERWDNWLQLTQARLLPRFTANGFEVIQTPKRIQEKLYEHLMNAKYNLNNLPNEKGTKINIYGPHNPKFYDLGEVGDQILNELKPLHEEWVGGMSLTSSQYYGTRIYLNGSSMVMHYDRVQTHVISSIVHIGHEYDNNSEPWPIDIEDHNGQLFSISLQPGQMMFYESAVCLHGRSSALKGSYYSSLFLHYRPTDFQTWSYTLDDIVMAVPPYWDDGVTEERGSRWAASAITVDSRVVAGASIREKIPDGFVPPYLEEEHETEEEARVYVFQ